MCLCSVGMDLCLGSVGMDLCFCIAGMDMCGNGYVFLKCGDGSCLCSAEWICVSVLRGWMCEGMDMFF